MLEQTRLTGSCAWATVPQEGASPAAVILIVDLSDLFVCLPHTSRRLVSFVSTVRAARCSSVTCSGVAPRDGCHAIAIPGHRGASAYVSPAGRMWHWHVHRCMRTAAKPSLLRDVSVDAVPASAQKMRPSSCMRPDRSRISQRRSPQKNSTCAQRWQTLLHWILSL